MGTSTDEIRQELTETREDLDRKIDIVQRRTFSSLRRYLPVAAGVAAGGAAVVGLAMCGVLLARSRRRPGLGERLLQAVPEPLWRLKEGAGFRIPAVRVAIGDRAFADERRSDRWREMGLRFAQSAGSAAGSAALGYAVRRVRSGQAGER